MTSANEIPGEGGAGGGPGAAGRRTARRTPSAPGGKTRRAPAERIKTTLASPERGAALAAGQNMAEPAVTESPGAASLATPRPVPPTAAATSRAASAARATSAPPVTGPADDVFARHARAYAAGRTGQQVTILNAGSTTARDLGADKLSADGTGVTVTLVDDDQPVTRAAVAARPSLSRSVVGDLRDVPLPPRSYDIVQCSSLLERIRHAELVLDRLVAAVKPGGLLLLRFCDRDSAGGFLDRVLPGIARGMIWRARRPGESGPYPAIYERLASARGLQAFALMRGLVIAERLALGGRAGGLPQGPPGFLAAQKLVARLSRGRLTAAHEELLYVLRKPENRFARVL